MKTVPKTQLDELRARSDIVEVIGSHLRLQRAGSTFKALCPFHKEKTPSFHVNPSRQIFHCFGCGAGGDVFSFVMKREGVDFMTAVRMLAQRAGMVIETVDEDPQNKSEKEQLFQVHAALATFYHRVLMEHPSAADARAYLKSRDLLDEAAKKVQFGFAPDIPDALLKFAAARKYDPALLEKAGILARAEGRADVYDRFRGRIMIPICDELGRVIAFTGRILHPEASPAKYVNSPETPLFRKSRVLFALHLARRAIVDARRAVLCEGQIDTIRCHLAGLENAVAAQGTAITEEHARILRRYADEIVLMLDADTAGQNAALRSAELLIASELSVRVAALPPGEDPDSLIRKAGRAAVERAIEQAVPALVFLVNLQEARGELASEAGIARVTRAVLKLIAAAPSPTHQERLLRQAAARLRLSDAALRQDLHRIVGARRGRTDLSVEAAETHPEHPADEIGALRTALRNPSLLPLFRSFLPERLFLDAICARLYRLILSVPSNQLTAEACAPSEAPEVGRLLSQLLSEIESETVRREIYTDEHAARDYILKLWRNDLQRQRDGLIRSATVDPDAEQKINDLCLHLAALRRGWDAALPFLELHEQS